VFNPQYCKKKKKKKKRRKEGKLPKLGSDKKDTSVLAVCPGHQPPRPQFFREACLTSSNAHLDILHLYKVWPNLKLMKLKTHVSDNRARMVERPPPRSPFIALRDTSWI
jgi:hypothetical protein